LWKEYTLLEMVKKLFRVRSASSVNTVNEHNCYLNRAVNVQLHGCFLCFSKKYFEFFDGLFPKTFLNMEEDILFYLTQKEHLTTVYTPKLKVYHKEDSASKARWASDKERGLKKTQYVLESAIEFKKLHDKL
jgi:GT2 family glycosyltransferase